MVHLEQVRAWFGGPLWEMEPADADAYFGKVLRGAAKGTRLARAQALKTYFLFLELRHKVEIHQLTGRVVECPVDEMNRPRGRAGRRCGSRRGGAGGAAVRRVARRSWRRCRKFAPAARNYAAARLMAEVGLRVNEVQPPRPRRCEVGAGPVRQAARPHGQGRPRVRARASGWCR